MIMDYNRLNHSASLMSLYPTTGLNATDSIYRTLNDVAFLTCYIISGFAIFIGNLFTGIVFLSKSQLRQMYMNIFLISLAFSDLLVAVLVLPGFNLFCTMSSVVPFSLSPESKTCSVLDGLKDFAFLAIVFNLLAVTWDRYQAFMQSLKYRSRINRKTVMIIIMLVWVVPWPIAYFKPFLMFIDPLMFKGRNGIFIYDNVVVFSCILLPMVVLLVINSLLTKAIRDQQAKTSILCNLNTYMKTETKQRTLDTLDLQGVKADVSVKRDSFKESQGLDEHTHIDVNYGFQRDDFQDDDKESNAHMIGKKRKCNAATLPSSDITITARSRRLLSQRDQIQKEWKSNSCHDCPNACDAIEANTAGNDIKLEALKPIPRRKLGFVIESPKKEFLIIEGFKNTKIELTEEYSVKNFCNENIIYSISEVEEFPTRLDESNGHLKGDITSTHSWGGLFNCNYEFNTQFKEEITSKIVKEIEMNEFSEFNRNRGLLNESFSPDAAKLSSENSRSSDSCEIKASTSKNCWAFPVAKEVEDKLLDKSNAIHPDKMDRKHQDQLEGSSEGTRKNHKLNSCSTTDGDPFKNSQGVDQRSIIFEKRKETKEMKETKSKYALITKRLRKFSRENKERNRTMSCLIVALIFVICWIPRCLYNILKLFASPDVIDMHLLERFSMLFLFLQSLTNPLVYSVYRNEFRQAAKELIRKTLRCRRENKPRTFASVIR